MGIRRLVAGAGVAVMVAASLAVIGGFVGPDAGAAPRTSPPAAFDVEPWSQVTGADGNEYIADADGRALQFRGINVKADHPAEAATDQLLADAEARGFNLLRLAVYWDEMEPTQGRWDEDYFAEIATVLDRAEAHGVWVVLDMHQDNFNPQFGGKGFPDWVTDGGGLPFEAQDVWFLNALQPALQEAWENLYERPEFRAAQVHAWQELVRRFIDRPNVVGYDLLNEPFGKLRPGEDLFTAAARVESTQLTAMYQRLTTAIRELDPNRWVFIEPPNLASLGVATSLGAIEGGNIAFFPHLYDSAIETATYTEGGVAAYDDSFFASFASVIDTYPDAHHVPMLFGEWGLGNPASPGMDRFVSGALRLMQDHGSGWTVFTGCRGSSYCVWDADGNDRPNIGQITQPWARAIAGAPVRLRWDPATRTLVVAFDDSSATGTTDLVVPGARVYPDGWQIVSADAPGSWSTSSTDGSMARPEVVSITAPRGEGGTHVFCLQPEGSTAACEVPADDEPTEPTTPTTVPPTAGPSTTVPGTNGGLIQPDVPAAPVTGRPDYTG